MHKADDTTQMNFWDHLDVLRGTLFRSVLSVCICSCFGLIFKDILFEDIILAPTRPGFCVYRMLGWDFDMSLINVEVSAQFFVHIKTAFMVGLVLAFPYIIWEIWKFVAPALYATEKKALRLAFVLASALFYVGVLMGYYVVLPVCLNFFMNYTVSDMVSNTITLNSYISMFITMVLMIGLVFEFPTIVLALSRLGILERENLRQGRKIAFVVILVIAALITPADPVSMFVLAAPMYLLYELSILLCSSQKKLQQ